ncbi:hypothetical protein EON65_37770 [archaeon]|nr:MAG: hypothetical protein EON65_37770 [archaeon]
MSCCPPNAWKFLAPDYNVAGNLQNVEGVDFYATGSSTVQAILLLPDIFGWNGGRTRTIADFFADEGFYVTVPRLMVPPQEGAIDGDGEF